MKITIIYILILLAAITYGQTEKVVDHFSLTFDGVLHPPSSLITHKRLAKARVGLALSGGGLRGVSQIGVLQALESANIDIHSIAGSSIGSVVGGLYASGYSPEEIWETLRMLDLNDILSDTPQRSTQFLGKKEGVYRAILQFRLENFNLSLPKAYTAGQKINELFTYLMLNAPVHAHDFANLEVPLKIIATDLLSGKKAILKNGDLALAMRASIAIPLLLDPVSLDSMLLADGGLLDNLPVDESRRMGADYVIAVNTTSPLRKQGELNAPWEIADQVTTIMQVPFKQNQLDAAQMVIDFSDLKGTSMDVGESLIADFYQEGISRTVAQLEKIKRNLSRLTISKQVKNNKSYFVTFMTVDSANINIKTDSLYRSISEREIYSKLITFYESGFFRRVFAQIKCIDQDTTLHYHLEPYPVLREVVFHGNSLLADSLLKPFFHSLIAMPINYYGGKSALQSLVRLYRRHGLSLAEIDSVYFDENVQRAHIFISEGRIQSVSYSGQQKTKNFVIAREFTLSAGEIFDINTARQGIKNVFATGLFQSVKLKPIKTTGGWNIHLILQEKKTQLIRFGLYYNRERKGKTYIEFSEENCWGTGNDITTHFQYGNRDKVISFNYRADRIFKSYLTNQINIHWDKSKHYYYKNLHRTGEYERRSYGVKLILGQQIQRFGTLSGFLRAEKIQISALSGHGYDTGSLIINTIGLTSVIDTRDQLPFPKSGKYHRFFYEASSGSFLGADISYFKVKNQLSSYWTIKERHTFCPQAIWGFSDLTTPFSEQFRIGGRDSFAGLREGELQGRHLFIASLKYRYFFPINTAFTGYLFLRLDIGAVWESVVDVSPQDFINGRCFGFSLQSPFGPVSLSYGMASNNQKRVYFSAGYDF